MNANELGLLDISSESVSFMPSKISREHTAVLFKDIPVSVKQYIKPLIESGWRFYVVNQTCGRCYYRAKVITIPQWIWDGNKGIKYLTWYISHECAHAYDMGKSIHGDSFMKWLIKICPEDCIKFELGYKPRNAARNGIGKITLVDLGL